MEISFKTYSNYKQGVTVKWGADMNHQKLKLGRETSIEELN